ncbi:MAG: dihydroxy-acid dehydratase [Deltaproteobacteria bacterium]|nr:dihydroxy-acid dehydratase [Deltaproteobacteria bacterium]
MPSLLHGCGCSTEDLSKHRIGIANTWSELNPGHIHLRRIAEAVKKGVKAVGMKPFEFNTIGPCDGLAEGHEGMNYILPARDIIAASIEIMAKSGRLEGLVLIGSCDKIVPGLLMAAARLDIPAIVITGGYHQPYRFTKPSFASESEFAQSEIGKFYFAKEDGTISQEEFEKALKGIVTGPGACPTMGTANTMQCLTEAIGMSLPYSAVLPAESQRKFQFAEEAGRTMKALLTKGLTPSKIMTAQAFRNAITVLNTIGGSTNAFIHLPAIAYELDIQLPLELFEEISNKTPMTCDVKPNGSRTVNAIDEAGGIPAVMKNVQSLLNLECQTVSGQTIADVVNDASIKDEDIIRPFSSPISADGGLKVLKGSLALHGAIVKKSAVSESMQQFSGPARVFESEEEAIYNLHNGKVQPGECVIIRNEGPIGGPGMREMAIAGHLVQLLGKNNALVTDGRFSGTNYGLNIGHVCPESSEKGAMAVVRDGDTVIIDIHQGKIDLDVSEEELNQRLSNWSPPEPRFKKGVLSLYSRNVKSAIGGATW